MLIPPKYTLNPTIVSLVSEIEACKQVIDAVNIPSEIEANIRRQSTLKSSLFSARIEGNSLNIDDLASSSRTQQKVEVFNILKAVNYLNRARSKDITKDEILNLHALTMQNLSPDVGKYRTSAEAIFSYGGIAIYMPPPHSYVSKLMDRLVRFINSDKERSIPIKAALSHYAFEKIHPFVDGNGRTGRLIMQKILLQGGYGMKGLLVVEEYLDNHRERYYDCLLEPEKDVTDYLTFILTAIKDSAEKIKKMILAREKYEAKDYLLPRRAEIYEIIKDQKYVSFDQIKRRFPKVNDRTLRYDLKKLQDGGFTRKKGSTRGVYYQAIN